MTTLLTFYDRHEFDWIADLIRTQDGQRVLWLEATEFNAGRPVLALCDECGTCVQADPDEDADEVVRTYLFDCCDVNGADESERGFAGCVLERCIYCLVVLVQQDFPREIPGLDDNEWWAEEAYRHYAGCEWIETRAHQLAGFA